MQPIKKMKTPSGVRDFSVCNNSHIFLLVVYDTIRIYDGDILNPLHTIKLDSTPRSSKISQCGKYFYIHDSNNTIYLYDTRTATIIQHIFGVPISTKNIRFSKNSQKMIYGSTQMLCLWNIKNCSIDVRTQIWKNINVYDINQDGKQFVLGTYNGVIYVMQFIQIGRCNQISIKRHKTCVASICFYKNQIISASHDGLFVISTISKDQNGERLIQYNQMKLKNIPKEIQTIGDNFYMYNHEGMSWFNKNNSLTGFTDFKVYRPYQNQEKEVIFVSMFSGEIQWWPAKVFKTESEIEKEKLEKQKIQREKQIEKDRNRYYVTRYGSGKQNTNGNYKIIIRR